MLNIKSIVLINLCLVASFDAIAERRWPDREFDCEVVTASGSQGLVSLQSFSLEEAVQSAVGLPAISLLGGKDSAARVVQCVEKGKGNSFTDSNFQAWFSSLDQ